VKKALVLVFSLCIGWYGTALGQNDSLNLEPVNPDLLSGVTSLENEAGISAYGQLGYVDLEMVKPAFKTIENETSQYIIGSVSLPDYSESDDVHVYIDTSGWMMAYYLNQELAAKIIDWQQYRSQGTFGTKLADALTIVSAQMGYALPPITYYDFRYPNANRLTVILDEKLDTGADSAWVTLPCQDHYFYGREWSHGVFRHGSYNANSYLRLDGEQIDSLSSDGIGWFIKEGTFTPLQTTCDAPHEISTTNGNGGYIDAYTGIVLVYKDDTQTD
jgi:hypothetical protein